jgi:hypothetical protein
MEQEKQRISQRLARLDAEREKPAANSISWKSPNVFWHEFGERRLQPSSDGEHARQELLR